MIFDFHVPHYFTKSVRHEISELSASTALADFSNAMVMLFEPIFLYKVLGLTVQQVLLFMGGVYLLYIFVIPFGGKIASMYGYRHAVALSTPFQILYWVFILAAQHNISYLYFAPLMLAVEKSLYWPGFHAIVSRYADSEQKGREFSAIYAVVNIAQTFGPFLGGYMLQRFGADAAFFAASLVYACSVVPLLVEKEVFIPKIYNYRQTWELYKMYPKKFLGYVGFGEELLQLTIWPIFIFILVKGYENIGFLATGASLAAAILALAMGKITDSYTKRILIKLGSFFLSLVWVAKFVANTFWSAFAMDSLGRAAKDVVFIPLSTVTYLRAEANHILPYVVFFEQSLSVGKLLACVLGIVLFSLTGSFVVLFILAGAFSLLYMLI
jgi:MFS family permease